MNTPKSTRPIGDDLNEATCKLSQLKDDSNTLSKFLFSKVPDIAHEEDLASDMIYFSIRFLESSRDNINGIIETVENAIGKLRI